MKPFLRKLQTIGGSLISSIPKPIAIFMDLNKGDEVRLEYNHKKKCMETYKNEKN